jgi:hypothetical protein
MSHHGDHGHGTPGGRVNGNPGYETTDAKAMPIVIFTVIMAVFTVGCFITGFGIYRVFEMGRKAIDPAPHPMAVKSDLPAGVPRLQITEAKDLAKFRAEQDKAAAEYSWVDRQAATVRIPVDKAIDRVLAKGGLESRE